MPSNQAAAANSLALETVGTVADGAGSRHRAYALNFTSAILFASLLLQRFGIPFGAKPLNVVGPIGLGLVVLGLLQGTLAFHRGRLIAFLLLGLCVMAGLSYHAMHPEGIPPNLASMGQFLLLTAFAVVAFAQPMEEDLFFRTVTRWFAFIAIAGAVQFVLQFVGVKLFAFTGLLPSSLLFESGYNLKILVGVGDLLKSNGFFLVEPSVFSQVMAYGLIIEILAFRRPTYLALFGAGLVLSFSGTGWLVLASFVLAAALGMGWRGLAIAAGTVVLLAVLVGGVALLAPDVAASLQARLHELSVPGTSGHQRFITPFWLLDDALTAHPIAAVLGLGSGVSERLNLAYTYDVNTPIKVGLDYGFPALIAYLFTLFGGRRSPVQAGLLFPSMVLLLLTGGYQEFAPVLFLVLLVISVARLQPSTNVGVVVARPRADAARPRAGAISR